MERKINSLPWFLSDLKKIPKNKGTVFSLFHCAGGSTMGYKLAGFDVLGGVEIDPKVMAVYKKNHNPKYSYLMGVKEFNQIPNKDLPKELFNLDILDGSPPCSSFSMAGSREKGWQKEKKFREGQTKQVLDDLFFAFLDTVEKLKPKIVIAENVSGMLAGNARGYVSEILKTFSSLKYTVQLFLLDSEFMGVPQKRRRCFFIAQRLGKPKLKLNFCSKSVSVQQACAGIETVGAPLKTKVDLASWQKLFPGQNAFQKYGGFSAIRKWHSKKPAPTLISGARIFHWDKLNFVSDKAISRIQTFPDDFDFGDQSVKYICGMSVPPFMMQRVVDQIAVQWFKK